MAELSTSDKHLIAELALHCANQGLKSMVTVSDSAPPSLRLLVLLSGLAMMQDKLTQLRERAEEISPAMTRFYDDAVAALHGATTNER